MKVIQLLFLTLICFNSCHLKNVDSSNEIDSPIEFVDESIKQKMFNIAYMYMRRGCVAGNQCGLVLYDSIKAGIDSSEQNGDYY